MSDQKCVEWPHDWIDITTNGGSPTAMCTRCNQQRPIVCAPDKPDTLAADFKEAEGLIDELRDLFVDVFDEDESYGAEVLKRAEAFLHKDDEK